MTMKRQDLHEYQNYCVRFLMEHPEAMLILEMGLGKSCISLTAILDLMFDSFEVSKVLVIAPLRVAKTVWPEEKDTWEHARFLRMSVMVGTAKQREAALRTPADVYVINRENVKWLTDYLEKRHIPWPFDMVVIDELSSFKNHNSQRWKALRKVRPKIKRMVGLTGTPASNGLLDLWAETYLIDNGQRLGRFIGRYRDAYFKAAGMNPYTGVVYNYVPLPGAEEKIYSRISDISVSMKALDYLDMPEFIPVIHRVDMEPDERTLYEEMKKELLVSVDGEEIDAANAAVLSGKLLQMANGAIYTDDREIVPIHSQKLLMLEDLIEQANGQNVLVAYWYQHDHSRIMEHLAAKGYTPRDIRTDADISDWNAGRIQVGLISPASAGHGLNIQRGGHILIWFSMIWSLEMYQQTNARLWRQGQKEVVTAHHIVCRDTVDEDVLKALEHKDTTQQNLIAAVKAHLTI
ncbi:SNF2-related protein [Chordicoccus furentiruminis]|uniref:SNF2-related protein n=1 Tax=Chordicoccus furentiruminis TaxID=2709410 RepID=UPI0023A8DABD|nr:SNF2-related protein [Chordicoccus furentiruminis]